MAGQDVVYANPSGDMGQQARVIVRTMDRLGPKRFIFISSMRIYDAVPGQGHNPALRPYRVVRLATTPDLHIRQSLGVHKPP